MVSFIYIFEEEKKAYLRWFYNSLFLIGLYYVGERKN